MHSRLNAGKDLAAVLQALKSARRRCTAGERGSRRYHAAAFRGSDCRPMNRLLLNTESLISVWRLSRHARVVVVDAPDNTSRFNHLDRLNDAFEVLLKAVLAIGGGTWEKALSLLALRAIRR